MRGDPVGARIGCRERCPHRIGMLPAPRVTDGGDMIDVDAEAKRCSH
jgi:hypothetical protein